jgi:hypothetical protein
LRSRACRGRLLYTENERQLEQASERGGLLGLVQAAISLGPALRPIGGSHNSRCGIRIRRLADQLLKARRSLGQASGMCLSDGAEVGALVNDDTELVEGETDLVEGEAHAVASSPGAYSVYLHVLHA